MADWTQGLQNGITDAGEWLGIGTNRFNREFNAAEAQKQRDWETEMSNTAYQRQVKDMEKAGINPAMAYANSSASGSSTPAGATAHNTSANHSNLGSTLNAISNLINSHTGQLRQDRYSKHLDYQEKEKFDTTTSQLYNSAGKLLRSVVTSKLKN